MERRLVGNSDLEVSVLSLGTATFGGSNEFFKAWGQTDVAQARRLVDMALEAGVNLFDTADVYSAGAAESILGEAIAGRRHQLLLSTKATFRSGPGEDDVGSSRAHLTKALDASLKRLRTDYIDLFQLHAFDAKTPILETLQTLDDFLKAGKVRHVGCSNFSGWHLMKSLGIAAANDLPRYVVHQAYYSLLSRDYEWELMPLAQDQGVGTLVWSPLSGGRLSGKLRRGAAAPDGSRAAAQGVTVKGATEDRLFAIVDTLDSVAAETGRSVSQVALRWVMQRPTISSLIIGARNEVQLRETLATADFVLDQEHVNRLDAASATDPAYPYWHQRETFAERNPPPV